ncbi:Death-inducer obliterator 1 [Desmophyllum pertusum]|uniref:Death-inducer obliterator 1 n=1 Tax=Desmophyllum pertusum TaxID=174260 RepID=A0A9W9YMG1_9CNID|nr:Death-inducer obliterator 1 [Desmophyllum pertusum]
MCVCRKKPHGNRFMICCDHCEEWFHGMCVGITMAQGRQMEKNGQDYVCPKCKVRRKNEQITATSPHVDAKEEKKPSPNTRASSTQKGAKDEDPRGQRGDEKNVGILATEGVEMKCLRL